MPFLIPTWALAQVWGPFILVRRDAHEYPKSALRRLLRHEMEHVRQWKRYGVLFPLVYVFNWVRAGFSYTNNELEKRARFYEDFPGRDEYLVNRFLKEHFDG